MSGCIHYYKITEIIPYYPPRCEFTCDYCSGKLYHFIIYDPAKQYPIREYYSQEDLDEIAS